MKKIIIILISLLISGAISSQSVSIPDTNASYYVTDVLLGNYILVFNISSNCIFTPIANLGYFENFNSAIGIDNGIILSTGDVELADDANTSGSSGATTGTGSDPELATLIPGYVVNDAAIIEFDYIPYTNLMDFRYVFASEEYPEYVNSSFNDVFGFFVSGPNPDTSLNSYNNENIAIIPGSTLPVTIDNVNAGLNSQYYVDNSGGLYVTYDAFTTPLDAILQVMPFHIYHIKIAIGDAGDSAFDSAVFLEENSFSSFPLQYSFAQTPFSSKSTNDAIEDSIDVQITITLPDIARNKIIYNLDIQGTATNGVDYNFINNQLIFPKDSISATINIEPIGDAITENFETVMIIIDGLNDTILVDINDKDYLIGIDQPKENIEIYPNPVKDYLIVKGVNITSYEILDVSGKTLIYHENTNENNVIDLLNIPSGIYFIKIITESDSIIKKIMKE